MPPSEGVPADESPCVVPGAHPGCGEPFDFRRLGLRSSAMLISPWVARGSVFQEPRGPTNTSQFELTSVPATVKTLFNLTSFLTKRDAWAGSFEELLLDAPRGDAPMHLPDAPPAAAPRGTRRRPTPMAARSGGARHCSSPHGEPEQPCRAARSISSRRAGPVGDESSPPPRSPPSRSLLSASLDRKIQRQIRLIAGLPAAPRRTSPP